MLKPTSALLVFALLVPQAALAQAPNTPPPGQSPRDNAFVLEPLEEVDGPPGISAKTKLVRRKRVGLVISGAITLGVSYLITPLMALMVNVGSLGFCDGCGRAAAESLIPFAGPAIALRGGFDDQPGLVAVTVLLGMAQASGIAMLTIGLIGKKVPPKPPRVAVTPLVGPMNGAALSMRF